jgi:hypothetical protein
LVDFLGRVGPVVILELRWPDAAEVTLIPFPINKSERPALPSCLRLSTMPPLAATRLVGDATNRSARKVLHVPSCHSRIELPLPMTPWACWPRCPPVGRLARQ